MSMNELGLLAVYLLRAQEGVSAQEMLENDGMPNTNNKIEGTFTNLKKRLNVHSGMTEKSRKRLICGFFLALAETHGIRKQDPSSEESC